MKVEELKGRHKGEEIALLGNGLSLYPDIEDLRTDKITTIGLNASWRIYESTYHLAFDDPQVRLINSYRPEIKNLIIGEHKYPERPKNALQIHMRFDRKVSFSNDITQGIHVCRSILWSGLQLANYMGAGYVYLMGVDLGGKRIKGHPHGEKEITTKSCLAQYELMGYLRNMIDTEDIGMKVFLSAKSKSMIRSIPRINYLTRHSLRDVVYEYPDDKLQVIQLLDKAWPMRFGG